MAWQRKSKAKPAASQSDDGGCFLLLFLALWYFGFVSFHSRETGRALERFEDLSAELSKAESKLEEMRLSVARIQIESESLAVRRTNLDEEVQRLETSRAEIALNLETAARLVAPVQPSRLRRILGLLFDGVPGGIVTAIILGAVGLLYRQLQKRNATTHVGTR